MTDFVPFPSIPRLSGNHMVITEKIDGTNADNYGFARWAMEHESELRGLGPRRHGQQDLDFRWLHHPSR